MTEKKPKSKLRGVATFDSEEIRIALFATEAAAENWANKQFRRGAVCVVISDTDTGKARRIFNKED